jgi:hypothetical protein
MNADDKYQHAERELRHHNRHIEHIDFHIEYAFLELCAFLMCPNVPMWCKKMNGT